MKGKNGVMERKGNCREINMSPSIFIFPTVIICSKNSLCGESVPPVSELSEKLTSHLELEVGFTVCVLYITVGLTHKSSESYSGEDILNLARKVNMLRMCGELVGGISDATLTCTYFNPFLSEGIGFFFFFSPSE